MSSPHSAKMMPTTTQKAMSPKDGEDVLGIEPVRSEGVDDGRVEQGGSSLGEIHPVRLSSRAWTSRRHRHRWASGRIRGRGPTTSDWIRSSSSRVTGGTSSTGTGTGGSRRSSPTSTRRRHPFHVAIENFTHDFNIGSVVRTANAFLAREVHIVGRRRWNRRGAMVTDRYQHVRHHEDADGAGGMGGGRGPSADRHRQPPGCGAARDRGAAAGVRPALRAGGRRPDAAGARTHAHPCCRSRSTARPARSMRGPLQPSPCMRGSASTSSGRCPPTAPA